MSIWPVPQQCLFDQIRYLICIFAVSLEDLPMCFVQKKVTSLLTTDIPLFGSLVWFFFFQTVSQSDFLLMNLNAERFASCCKEQRDSQPSFKLVSPMWLAVSKNSCVCAWIEPQTTVTVFSQHLDLIEQLSGLTGADGWSWWTLCDDFSNLTEHTHSHTVTVASVFIERCWVCSIFLCEYAAWFCILWRSIVGENVSPGDYCNSPTVAV